MKAESASQDAAALHAAGVTALFGVPGGGPSLELIDACESRGIPFHLTAHEAAGAIMAATYGRLSGVPGVAIAIKGPGTANQLPGIAHAFFERDALLTVSEAYAANASSRAQHKRMPQDRVVGPLCKAIAYRSEISPVAQLMRIAAREEPGPVHFNLASGENIGLQSEATPRVDLDDLAGIAEALGSSRTPMLVLGGAVARLADESVRTALEALRVPCFTTVAAKGLIDESRPHSAGILTGAGRELAPEVAVLERADLVIGVALRANEMLGVPKTARYVGVELEGVGAQQILDPVILCSSLGGAVRAICKALEGVQWGDDLLEEARAALHAGLDGELRLGRLYSALSARWRGEARLVTDVGNFTVVAEHAWQAARRDDYISSCNGRFMGTAIPMALGAVLHDRKPTICVVGDGGLPPCVAELRTAALHRLPLLVVLFTDGGFGSIRGRAARLGLTTKPLEVPGTNWCNVLGALGIPATRVRTGGDWFAAVDDWVPADGPRFIEVVLDPDAYMHETARLRD